VIVGPVRAAQSQDVERPRGEEPEWPQDQDFGRR